MYFNKNTFYCKNNFFALYMKCLFFRIISFNNSPCSRAIKLLLDHFLTMGSIKVICLNVSPPYVPELPENWTDTRETLLEGMVFQLKYLGVTMVEQPKGEELSAAAVKRIVATVRKRRRAQSAITHRRPVIPLLERRVLGCPPCPRWCRVRAHIQRMQLVWILLQSIRLGRLYRRRGVLLLLVLAAQRWIMKLVAAGRWDVKEAAEAVIRSNVMWERCPPCPHEKDARRLRTGSFHTWSAAWCVVMLGSLSVILPVIKPQLRWSSGLHDSEGAVWEIQPDLSFLYW